MHKSVRRGVGEILVNNLLRRDISSEVTNVKDSFSSWDKCMDATYCKFVDLSPTHGLLLTNLGGPSLLL